MIKMKSECTHNMKYSASWLHKKIKNTSEWERNSRMVLKGSKKTGHVKKYEVSD